MQYKIVCKVQSAMSFEYISSLLSFDFDQSQLNQIIYYCFVHVIEEQVDDIILEQFMNSHYDAELLLSIVHETISSEYKKYKNDCLRRNYSPEECNAYNDDLYTTDYDLLCDDIRSKYSEICYYILKTKTDEYMYNKLSNLKI